MTNEKLAAQHYLKTNILGAYETADIIWQSDSEGTSHRTFADSFVYTDESSHILSVSRPTVYGLLQRKEFRWIQIGGGKYRISKKSFDEWLDNQ